MLLPLSPRRAWQVNFSLPPDEVALQFDQDGDFLPSRRPDQTKGSDDDNTDGASDDEHFRTFLPTQQDSAQGIREAGDESPQRSIPVALRCASPLNSQSDSVLVCFPAFSSLVLG